MINKHLASQQDSQFTNSGLFTLDRLPLLLLLRRNYFFSSPKTSKLSVRKTYRPSLYSISPYFHICYELPLTKSRMKEDYISISLMILNFEKKSELLLRKSRSSKSSNLEVPTLNIKIKLSRLTISSQRILYLFFNPFPSFCRGLYPTK